MALLIQPATARTIVNCLSPSSIVDEQIQKLALDTLGGRSTTAPASYIAAAASGAGWAMNYSGPAAAAAIALPTTRTATGRYAFPGVSHFSRATNPIIGSLGYFLVPLIDQNYVTPMLEKATSTDSAGLQLWAVAVRIGAAMMFELPRMAVVALQISAAVVMGAAGAIVGVLGHAVRQVQGQAPQNNFVPPQADVSGI